MTQTRSSLPRATAAAPGTRRVSVGPARGARYLGSKVRVVDRIMEILGPPESGTRFVDAFAGTGVVASRAADLGWHVLVNDHMRSAVALSRARLLHPSDVPFRPLGGYTSAINALVDSDPQQSFFTREYSPLSQEGRMYFRPAVAARIDGMRALLRSWVDQGLLTSAEQDLLTADLILAVGAVANTAGTYGCFLSHWTEAASRDVQLIARRLRTHPVAFEATCCDASLVPVRPDDVVYMDPPYTKRQYAAYYHVNETLAHMDTPLVTGKTGLRPWKDRASEYCYKARALAAIEHLVAKFPAKRVLVSYSDEGHVALDELRRSLAGLGSVALHDLGSIGRYAPNNGARARRRQVGEWVLELEKH